MRKHIARLTPLIAYLQSNRTAEANKALNDVTFKLTDLLKMIFDDKLYKKPTDKADPNLLEYLVGSVKNIQQRLKQITEFGILLMMGVSMCAEAGWFGIGGGASWKEEVLLHDGQKIIVERTQKRGGRGEIGQSPIKEHDITFTLPGSGKPITWKDEYSEDVGHSNFDLVALHILNGTPYIVVSPYGCLAYNKWGRPNPPYVFFKFDGKAWQRIQITEFPLEFTEINLVINASAHEKEATSLPLVRADIVKEFDSSLPQPEYHTILREPVKPEPCPRYSSGPKAPIPIVPRSSSN